MSTSGVLPAIGEQSPAASHQLDVEKGDHDNDGSHDPIPPKRRVRMVIVRVEVEDTGVGLRPADMEE